MDDWVNAAVALVASLMGAALLTSIETALVGLPEARVRAEAEGSPRSVKRLGYWLREQVSILTALLFVRLLTLVGAGVAGVELRNALGLQLPGWGVVATAAVAILMLGHLGPRAIGKRYALELAVFCMPFVRLLTTCLLPLVWLVGVVARLVARVLRIAPSASAPFWTFSELRRLTEDARVQVLGKQNEDLLSSIIEFSDTVIREIMVPRTGMVVLPVTATREEIWHTVTEAGHSRLPVYEETVDNILGLLHVKDLFVAEAGRADDESQPFDLRKYLRPSFYVPEVMQISELLREFQRRKTHMAIVVDEYGGTGGVVTLEDIIEEIVGEIQDEYDVEDKQFRVVADNKVVADGRVNVWDLGDALGVEFPEDAGYETLAGFLMHQVGYLPQQGAVINWDELRFTIKEANEKRIGAVEIDTRNKAESSGR